MSTSSPPSLPKQPPETDDDTRHMEDLAAVRLVRLAELVSRLTERAYAGLDLKLTDLRILAALHGTHALSIAEISRHSRVDKAWISRLTRDLEQKELVERIPHPADTRSTLVMLTKKGRAMQKRMRPVAFAREERMLEGVERDKFFGMLDQLSANLHRLLDEIDEKSA